jgi:hypothetical protein
MTPPSTVIRPGADKPGKSGEFKAPSGDGARSSSGENGQATTRFAPPSLRWEPENVQLWLMRVNHLFY